MPASPIRRVALAAIALLLVTALPAAAQTAERAEHPLSLRIPTGAFIPTGGQGHMVKGAEITAVQLAWALRPSLAVTGTFGWAHSRNLAAIDAPRVDIFVGDLGLERQLINRCIDCRVGFSGFAGLGAGARRYDQRGPGFGASTAFAGYVSTGGEVRIGRVGLRLEARDYLGGATALPGTRAGVGNDVVIMAGLRLARRSK